MTQVFLVCFCAILEKFSMDMFMGSPIGDCNIIDIKEKYKLIVGLPDSYIGRHVISVHDTCKVTRWYDVGKVTALKINTCSSWLFVLSHMWPNSVNHRHFWTNNYIYGSMLWRNRLVFRASYGQPQFSTMTEGRHNQWAGKQAPDHCPILCSLPPRTTDAFTGKL